jgi:hypothetical protein
MESNGGLRPSYSAHVRWSERGAPVQFLRVLLADRLPTVVLSPVFEPVGILLQDVVIRHARDVVGDHAGHTLAGELGLAGIR